MRAPLPPCSGFRSTGHGMSPLMGSSAVGVVKDSRARAPEAESLQKSRLVALAEF